MPSWPSLVTTIVCLLCTITMARLDLQKQQTFPVETEPPNVNRRQETARTRPLSTAPSSRPTESTPYAVPLTTTFTPPEPCNQGRLTMLSSPGYFIWFNEPVPVPGTTVSDCYPPEFMEYYTTYHVNPTTVESLVPLMSPLICPFGWQIVFEEGDYQACCPFGYSLTPPRTTTLMDPKRPAYGGTCYHEWPLSSSTFIDVFDSASSSGSLLITASTTGFANYAHVIDGIAVPTLSPSSASVESDQPHGSERTLLSSGAIIGIAVGALAGLGLVATGIYLFFRRRRQTLNETPPAPATKDEAAFTAVNDPVSGLSSPSYLGESVRTYPSYSELAAGESHIHELDAVHMRTETPRILRSDSTQTQH
ncbi:hypothetical protein F5Y14DRAFT_157914 [Nemania sp. NC0429]|nr:hypothetical protein F5Y14DRAFT_157914 [Nemania sp. NC0429]